MKLMTAMPEESFVSVRRRGRSPAALRSLWLSAVTLALSATVNDACGDELAWKFAPGDRFKVSYEQTVEQTTEVLLQPVKATTVTRLELSWQVESVEASGNAILVQSFDRIAMEMTTSRGETIGFDSADETRPRGAAGELARGIAPVFGAPFRVTMTPRGEIVSIEVPEESLAKLREAPGTMRLQRYFRAENLKETLALVAAILPEGDATPGATWKLERDSANPELPIGVVHELTYVGRGEGDDAAFARIEVATTLVPREGSPKREDGSPVPTIESQSSSGVIWFDDASGHPVRTEQTLNLTTASPLREMTIRSTATTRTVARVEKLAAGE